MVLVTTSYLLLCFFPRKEPEMYLDPSPSQTPLHVSPSLKPVAATNPLHVSPAPRPVAATNPLRNGSLSQYEISQEVSDSYNTHSGRIL